MAFVAEGISFIRAIRETGGVVRTRDRTLSDHLRVTRDPPSKVVVLEDAAVLVGIVFAASSIALHQITGDHWWDALCSIAIGCVLAHVAFRLGSDTEGLLLGEAAHPEERDAIRRAVDAHDTAPGSKPADRGEATRWCRCSRCSRWRSVASRC